MGISKNEVREVMKKVLAECVTSGKITQAAVDTYFNSIIDIAYNSCIRGDTHPDAIVIDYLKDLGVWRNKSNYKTEDNTKREQDLICVHNKAREAIQMAKSIISELDPKYSGWINQLHNGIAWVQSHLDMHSDPNLIEKETKRLQSVCNNAKLCINSLQSGNK